MRMVQFMFLLEQVTIKDPLFDAILLPLDDGKIRGSTSILYMVIFLQKKKQELKLLARLHWFP